ncbi:MAG: HNH endonuclease [Candidatus Aenigmatarchaeota archaeon]
MNTTKKLFLKKIRIREPIPKSLRQEVFKRDGYKCVECGATKETTTLHVDHIIPKSEGGTDELDNLQTLCEKCNLAKSNRKWRGGGG